ncbi:SagB family peptide dehydrogenase [Streptomyces sp. NPDC046197]|uniref:SagB family peptide dehydrogenase n=1 Tax=Streptomyces sp. NPDC046197 TaxID=3154337 RepID=UPI0034059F4A
MADTPTAAPPLSLRFWQRTFEDVRELFAEGQGEEGGPEDPLPTKTYRGLPRHPLSAPARAIGDARWSFAGHRRAHPAGPPRRDTLDEPAVSALLHHAYGLARIELGPHAVWPHHRTVASARCFYPVELYLWTAAASPGLPAGCYHYDPAHHALTRLREGGIPETLRTATGTGTTAAPPHALLVVAVHFRKAAFRYRDYAYRLCAQEAGMTVGNLLMAAGALGLGARVHHRFDADVVHRAVGVDGDEEAAFAVVDLSARHPVGAPPADADDGDPLPALEPHHVRRNRTDSRLWAGLRALDRAARGEPVSSAPVDEEAFHVPAPAGCPAPVPLDDAAAPAHVELADALRARDSGGRMFLPQPCELPFDGMQLLLRHALEPVPSDHAPAALRPLVDCHVLVLGVAGLPAGLYRMDPSPALVAQPAPDWPAVVSMLCERTPSVNAAKANAIVFLSVDRQAGERWFGARGYRVLHQEAGVVAQRISVLAAAAGVSARVTNGYDDADVRTLTGADRDVVPVFTLVLGRRRPTAQYEPPLIW